MINTSKYEMGLIMVAITTMTIFLLALSKMYYDECYETREILFIIWIFIGCMLIAFTKCFFDDFFRPWKKVILSRNLQGIDGTYTEIIGRLTLSFPHDVELQFIERDGGKILKITKKTLPIEKFEEMYEFQREERPQ